MQGHSSARTLVPEAAPDDAVLTPLRAVSERTGLDPLASRLAQLQSWLGDDLAELEAAIVRLHTAVAEGEDNLARRAARHLLARPGKRIRPVCVLLSARLADQAPAAVVRDVAVACELVHAATLLHDDVIDEGVERRGAQSARMVYGNSASILAGDYLLIEALRLVEHSHRAELLTSLLTVISDMVAAEAVQLERRGRFEPRRDVYLHVIRGKTASLFRWALEAGALLGGASRMEAAALGRAGTALGIAFQLVDDALDLEGDSDITGKSALADLREGKLTWPLIVAVEREPALLNDLRRLAVADDEASAQAICGVVERARRLGALDATRDFALEQAEAARRELEAVRPSPARRAIELVIDGAVHRIR